ncbi:MAG: GGDEF domain-containing protein [Chloroflexota bacterium]|nr:GGDEF domain-containing protein [Chloroflexota bacterium]
MAGTLRSSLDARSTGPTDPGLLTSWRVLTGSFGLLGLAGFAAIVANPGQPISVLVLGLAITAGVAAVIHQRSAGSLEASRRTEAEILARILQGMSRSASAEGIVQALLAELGRGTGADHTVVVRRRSGQRSLEARLAGTRPDDPTATIELPIADLALEAGDGPTAAGERIEARVRSDFALSHTLMTPLRTGRGVIGAIVLARRTGEPWSAGSRRILQAAAIEAAAALERVESHRDAEARASTDVLTGLPNRRYFDEFCSLLAERRRADDAIGILMVDIDHFKRVNDRFGHEVGDEVLRAVAGAIAGAVRDDDVPARYGGEEFVVLLRNPSGRVALEIAERVRVAIAGLDLRALGPGSISASVGAAVQVDPDQPIAELLADADRALFRAKRSGRDRVVAAPIPSGRGTRG